MLGLFNFLQTLKIIQNFVKNIVVLPVSKNNIWNKQHKNALLLTFHLANTPNFLRKSSAQAGVRTLSASSKLEYNPEHCFSEESRHIWQAKH